MVMLEVYWICLIGGVIFALISTVFGDLLGDFFDGIFDALSFDSFDFLHPMVLVSGITIFGASGVLLTKYSSMETLVVALLSLIIALALSIVLYFTYVKPMKNSENSIGYSMQDLVGKIGEVTVTIPVGGYGEVLLKVGAGNTNQIAASLEREEIPAGTRVVVGDTKEGVLYVFPYSKEEF